MEYVHSPIVGILGALFIFGLAIFAHELGHFVMAKLTGVGVKEFAIGMGPKLFSIVRGGTAYSIRAVPFGGFVMLTGAVPKEWEESESQTAREPHVAIEEPPAKKEDKDLGDSVMEDVEALRGKPTWVKVAIFSSGVAMNFVAAMVAMGVIYSVGFNQPLPMPSQIGLVEEGTPYYEQGLRTLDTIVSINDKPVTNWDEIYEVLATEMTAGKETWKIVVQRDGQDVTLQTDPLLKEGEMLKLEPAFEPFIAGVHPTGPAAHARTQSGVELKQKGIVAGDRVLEVNKQPIRYFYELEKVIRSSPNQIVELKIKRASVKDPILFYPEIKPKPEDPSVGQLGVIKDNSRQERIKEPVLTAFARAPERTFNRAAYITVMTFSTLGKLFTDFNSVKGEVSGPVGIMTMAYQASRSGLQQFITLFVILNLALMVFNLLPIPVLDGGHIAVSIIEGVSRRQIPPKILSQTYTVVAILLICLMLLLTYQDIKTWFFRM